MYFFYTRQEIFVFGGATYNISGGKKMGQIIGEGITFDDVLLVPSYSQVVPNQVDITT